MNGLDLDRSGLDYVAIGDSFTGRSSGDGVEPKRPGLEKVE